MIKWITTMNLFDEIREHVANGELEQFEIKIAAVQMYVNTVDSFVNENDHSDGVIAAVSVLSHAFTCGCDIAKRERDAAINHAQEVKEEDQKAAIALVQILKS